MSESHKITIAAKCAPDKAILMDIEKAGLTAVELYTNHEWLRSINRINKSCKEFSFRYAVHAPTDGYEPDLLAELVDEIKVEVGVFHDIIGMMNGNISSKFLKELIQNFASRIYYR